MKEKLIFYQKSHTTVLGSVLDPDSDQSGFFRRFGSGFKNSGSFHIYLCNLNHDFDKVLEAPDQKRQKKPRYETLLLGAVKV